MTPRLDTTSLTLFRTGEGGGEFARLTYFFKCFLHLSTKWPDFRRLFIYWYVLADKKKKTRKNVSWDPPGPLKMSKLTFSKTETFKNQNIANHETCFIHHGILDIPWNVWPNRTKIVGRNDKNVTRCFSCDILRSCDLDLDPGWFLMHSYSLQRINWRICAKKVVKNVFWCPRYDNIWERVNSPPPPPYERGCKKARMRKG